MRERQRATIQDLREAIERLPRTTRIAMLEGIERNEIIAGAYTNDGGVCPILAAHRAGGRGGSIAFAHAWDRFAFREAPRRFWIRAARFKAARRATERELRVLRTHLEASLLDEGVAWNADRNARAFHASAFRPASHAQAQAPFAPESWSYAVTVAPTRSTESRELVGASN